MKRLALAVIPFVFAGCASAPADSPTSSPDVTSQAPTQATSTSQTPTPTPTPTQTTPATKTAAQLAKQIQQGVESVKSTVQITEDNDPNNLIGRPNGYTDGAVLYDSGVKCAELGNSCGATIEVWPTAAAAKARSEYLQAIYREAPALGSEYHTLRGNVLLRVFGKLKPSIAKQYAAEFVK